MHNSKLLVKPLRDQLTGLRKKIERLDDDNKVIQSIIGGIHNILFECERLDIGEVQDGLR